MNIIKRAARFLRSKYGPSDDYWYRQFPMPTASGVDVDDATALNFSAVYCAITVIAQTLGTLPLHLYRKNGKSREVQTGHPLDTMLHDAPNKDMPAVTFRETLGAHVVSWGNQYAEIVKDGRGRIIELWPIAPNRVKVYTRNAETFYGVWVNSEEVIIPAARMLHIPGLGFDGLMGYSVLQKARESIGLALAAEEFGNRFFGNGTHPGVIAQHPSRLSQEAYDRLKTSLESSYSGLGQSHRMLILEEGLQMEKIGVPPDDAQFLQTREFSVVEIARWFNLHPHKLKDHSRSTFSNIEHLSIDHVVDCIRPWCVRLEQWYNFRLLSDAQKRTGFYFEHNLEGLLRGDNASRAAFYNQLFQIGAMSVNDIREKENMNPVKNGDTHFVPLNMIPIEMASQPERIPEKVPVGDAVPEDEDEDEERSLITIAEPVELQMIEQRATRAPASVAERDRIARRYHSLIQDAAAAIVGYEVKRIKTALSRAERKEGQSSEQVVKKIQDLYEVLPSKIKSRFGPVLSSYSEMISDAAYREIGIDPGNPKELKAFTGDYVDGYVSRHIGRSVGQLTALSTRDELDRRADEWSKKRPTKIAVEETVRAGSATAAFVYFANGFKSTWRIRGAETCPYCKPLDGRKISREETFVDVGNYEPRGKTLKPMKIRGIKKHPPLHQGCDCTIHAG